MAAFRNSASDASSHPVLTEYQSDLHRFAHQAAIRVEQDRQVALPQDAQELPEPLGGTLIESALPAIHSVQPRPQAFGSPMATTKIIGSLRTFANRGSSSLGSSLAAIETAGRQQSAAATHRINLPIITPLRAEDRLSYYASIDHLMLLDQLAISIPGIEAAVIRHFQKLMCCSCRRRMPAPYSPASTPAAHAPRAAMLPRRRAA